jgi:hypothetical protein
MRLRQRDLKPYIVKRRVPMQDVDGTTYEDYEEKGNKLKANIKPAGGKVMSEIYGEKLKYMKTMITDDITFSIKELDGVCVKSKDKPDYKVVAIKDYTDHRIIDLEKV